MMRSGWRSTCFALALALLLLAGCRTLREGSDRGHRILDRDGLPPAKLFGYIGAAVGYTVGLPMAIVLLPTYPFARLEYLSGPDHDVPMPGLFAPLEIGGGTGAFLAAAPFWPFHPARLPPAEGPARLPPAEGPARLPPAEGQRPPADSPPAK